MTALTELLAKVEAAQGADNPELARDLCKAFIDREYYPTIGTMIAGSLTGPEHWQLGTAIALVERLLPGWCHQLVRHRISGSWRNDVCLWDPDEADEDVGACESEGATLALAIIAALRAAPGSHRAGAHRHPRPAGCAEEEMSAKGKAVFVCEIDPAELACRIFEGLNEITRPAGATAAQALEVIRKEDPDVLRRLMKATHRAAKYLEECIGNGKRPS